MSQFSLIVCMLYLLTEKKQEGNKIEKNVVDLSLREIAKQEDNRLYLAARRQDNDQTQV